MDDRKLTLELERTEVLSGEALPLKAVVTNSGTQPFTVRVGPVSPVTYEFRSPADQRVLMEFSQAARLASSRTDPDSPPVPVWKEDVAPGASKTILDDPALYARGPIAPGRYHLVGRAETDAGDVASPPVDLLITPARIRYLDTLFCPYESAVAVAFDHTDAKGSIWIFQEEAEGSQIDSGVFYRKRKLESQDALSDLALAIKTSPESRGRWIAWLQNNSLGALRGWGRAVMGTAGPSPVELQQALLVKPGFQMADGRALFLVAGLKDGGAFIQSFTVGKDSPTPGAVAPLAETLPKRILARYSPGAGNGRLRLLWAEQQGQTTRLYLREYGADGKNLTPEPTQLYARDAALQALELWPLHVPSESAGTVHAVWGPECRKDQNQEMFVVARIPLSAAGTRVAEHVFAAPPALAESWAVSPWDGGEVTVLAKAQDKIFCLTPPALQWQTLADHLKRIGHLRVVASPDRYRAGVWVDPDSGVGSAPVPIFQPNR